ncbi:hypothetical protein Pla22_52290 [Rubripirellula amarantea]|uniref:Uncharacterized protein n=1 Tax=Rubripirellula amarantea TaxID=2527999 RepID=A0A5C5WDU0_9BACT|nr:hypothetical protein Pla22_52290 [Rubripirellula amarantea]
MALLFPLFPLAFAAMWIVVSLLLSRMGGWTSLADVYRIDSEDPPGLSRFVTGRFNLINYSSCLRVASTAEHLYLSVLLPFRIGHPALLIPWSDIKIQDPSKGMLGRTASLSVCGVSIDLPNRFLPPNPKSLG